MPRIRKNILTDRALGTIIVEDRNRGRRVIRNTNG
jgi:hypothetical protein